MRVDVYWNLHKRCWSIRHKGRVIRHATYVHLQDVRFVVSEAGRQRVLREGRKNVHAFARGELVDAAKGEEFMSADRSYHRSYKDVTYNPFKSASFYRRDTGKPVTRAPQALLGIADGRPRMLAVNPVDDTPVEVWRLETADGSRGAFGSGGLARRIECETGHDPYEHPCPHEDIPEFRRLYYSPKGTDPYYFGCVSRDQLLMWFSAQGLKTIEGLGRVAVYEAAGSDVLHGETQVAFVKERAKLKAVLSPSEVAHA